MPDTTQPEIVRFTRDMTVLWPCRRGDFLLWLGYRDLSSGPGELQCHDFWEMRDGYRVTFTNRLEDLSPGFQLHPTEVCNSFAYRLMPKIEKGDYPDEPISGPNLWKLRSGDRVAWVGEERPGRRSVTGVLAILDCDECALAVGEGDKEKGLEGFIGFGRPSTPTMRPTDVVRCQAAVRAVKQLGLPRTWGPEWVLG
jgi:hypothetical protein